MKQVTKHHSKEYTKNQENRKAKNRDDLKTAGNGSTSEQKET